LYTGSDEFFNLALPYASKKNNLKKISELTGKESRITEVLS